MYVASVALLLFILPVLSIGVELLWLKAPLGILALTGQWFVFWAVGVRLAVAGVRQMAQPGFTAKEILGIEGRDVYVIVRELGFANLSMGTLGLISLWGVAWIEPAALGGGLYYFLAGIGHVMKKERNLKEEVATWSDLFVSLVLLGFFATTILT